MKPDTSMPTPRPNRPSLDSAARRRILVLAILILGALSAAIGCRDAAQLTEIRPPQPVTDIPKNLSGLTWNQETGTLFAVTNQPPCLFELSPEGTVLRRVVLRGFKDTEGITHLGGSRFALVEERKGFLCIFQLPADATEIAHDSVTRLALGSTKSKNKGFEGVTFDATTRTIQTMREGKPFICLSIPLDAQFRPGPMERTRLPRLDVRDVASIFRDPDGTLWVLSEASSRLVQLDRNGRELRRFTLQGTGSSFRPEGITRSPDGRIFVVGEPNILAVYKLPE